MGRSTMVKCAATVLAFVSVSPAVAATTAAVSSAPSGVVVVGSGSQTFVGLKTAFNVTASSLEGRVVSYEWDFDGDGSVDHRSDRPAATHSYSQPGAYNLVLKVTDTHGDVAFTRLKVVVDPGSGVQRDLPPPERVRPASLRLTLAPADGVQNVYAILIGGVVWPWWDTTRDFYDLLVGVYGCSPQNLFVLLACSGVPSTSPEIVDGRATRDTLEMALTEIASKIDEDDLFIWWTEWMGNGYLGYVADSPDNIALHGYFGMQPKISGLGDEQDYRERDLEMSLFCAGGIKDGRDFHYGMGEWGVTWYPNSQISRTMVLSHFTNMYVESMGYLSDNDQWLEKFVDFARGDYNKNGYIEPELGEVWDYDGDGNQPWDRETGLFDEDDWGFIDSLQDDCLFYEWHSSLLNIPFLVYDAGLDNHADLDVWPSGIPAVDGTDSDNDGCIDGFDLNEDGDLDDWVTINESMSIYDEILEDDEVRDYVDWIAFGRKAFITNTCYGGGFVDDLSADNVIVIAGSREICRSASGFLTGLLTEALGIYASEADVSGDGKVSFVEAFNHASIHPHLGCAPGMDRFQYDDDADGASHEDPIPDGGDGPLGMQVFLAGLVAGIPAREPVAGWPSLSVGPSPFTHATTVRYSVPRPARVSLRVYDVAGRLATTLVDAAETAGLHEVAWVAEGASGKRLNTGLYFFRLMVEGVNAATCRVLLLK